MLPSNDENPRHSSGWDIKPGQRPSPCSLVLLAAYAHYDGLRACIPQHLGGGSEPLENIDYHQLGQRVVFLSPNEAKPVFKNCRIYAI